MEIEPSTLSLAFNAAEIGMERPLFGTISSTLRGAIFNRLPGGRHDRLDLLHRLVLLHCPGY